MRADVPTAFSTSELTVAFRQSHLGHNLGQEIQQFCMFVDCMFEEHVFACSRQHVRVFEAFGATVS